MYHDGPTTPLFLRLYHIISANIKFPLFFPHRHPVGHQNRALHHHNLHTSGDIQVNLQTRSYSTWPDGCRAHYWDQFPQLSLQRFASLFLAHRTQLTKGRIHPETLTRLCSLQIGGSRSSQHKQAYDSPFCPGKVSGRERASYWRKHADGRTERKSNNGRERLFVYLKKCFLPTRPYCICIWSEGLVPFSKLHSQRQLRRNMRFIVKRYWNRIETWRFNERIKASTGGNRNKTDKYACKRATKQRGIKHLRSSSFRATHRWKYTFFKEYFFKENPLKSFSIKCKVLINHLHDLICL